MVYSMAMDIILGFMYLSIYLSYTIACALTLSRMKVNRLNADLHKLLPSTAHDRPYKVIACGLIEGRSLVRVWYDCRKLRTGKVYAAPGQSILQETIQATLGVERILVQIGNL